MTPQNPLDNFPAGWIAAADQETAQCKNFLHRLVQAHKADIDTYQTMGISGEMPTIGLLAANILQEKGGKPIDRTTIAYLLATAVDIMARLDEDPSDPAAGLPT